MPTKQLKPGDEVDSWCTKCKMDLMHRIIAMQNGSIIRVECRTCNGHHNYRKPKSAAAEPRGATARSSSTRAASSGGASPRKAAAAEIERQREKTWEKAVLGQSIASFKAYRPSQTFSLGE